MLFPPVGDIKLFSLEDSDITSDTDYPFLDFEKIINYFPINADISDYITLYFILTNKIKNTQRRCEMLNREMSTLHSLWKEAGPLHFYVAFLKARENLDELVLKLGNNDFKKMISEEVTEIYRQNKQGNVHPDNSNSSNQKSSSSRSSDDSSSSDDEDFKAMNGDPVRKVEPVKTSVKKMKPKPKSCIKCPSGVNEEEWERWSEAKKKSFLNPENKNSFLYRNLPPGEKKRNGHWTPEEKQLFLKRLQEFRVKGLSEKKWGLFSETIPGRVGYQCANFYRKLIAEGELDDNNYCIDEAGNLHYKDRRPHHRKDKEEEVIFDEESNDQDQSSTFTSNSNIYEKNASNIPEQLKNKTDLISGEEIKVPTLSPFGTVLDYNTWMNLITKGNRLDPFTLDPVRKRQLVILTKENYDEYKDQIKKI